MDPTSLLLSLRDVGLFPLLALGTDLDATISISDDVEVRDRLTVISVDLATVLAGLRDIAAGLEGWVVARDDVGSEPLRRD